MATDGVCSRERRAGQKEGGQALIGGLDITVSRNFFGSQIDSFETHLPAPASFPAVEGCASFLRRSGGCSPAENPCAD